MTMQAESGMSARGFYEVRSGKCPDCGTVFDPGYNAVTDTYSHPMLLDDRRWCPKCLGYRLGKLKQTGEIKGKL